VNDPLRALLAALDLEEAEPDGFEGQSVETARPRIFGGELLAQSLVAAARTVKGQAVLALHAHFLSPGDPARPIVYRVRRVRDGRRVALRQVAAWQGAREIALAVVSFAVDFADAFTYQHVAMPDVEGPESRRSELEERLRVADGFREEDRGWLLTPRAVEVRQVRPVPLLDPPPLPPVADTWLRATGKLPDDPAIHAAVLAYASDLTLLDIACQPRGLSWIDARMEQASLDHVMWFHRPFRMDQWVLYAQAALSLGSGRALVRGSVFTRDGTLAAIVTQEGLSRLASER
jgi:acyl-CoA thioesterase-2